MEEQSSSNYMRFLPSIFQEPNRNGERSFLETYLKIFERVLTGIKDENLREILTYISFSELEAVEQGEIPERLREELKLSKNATLANVLQSKEWKIDDHDRQYFIKRIKEGDFPAEVTFGGRKGIHEFLDVISDLFYPQFSFLFKDKEDVLPELGRKEINELHKYISPVGPSITIWLESFLSWFSNWMALSLGEQWTLEKKREVISKIIPIYRMRGTKRGLEEFLKIYVGDLAVIKETIQPFQLEKNSIVGADFAIEGRAYFFIVEVNLSRAVVHEMQIEVEDNKKQETLVDKIRGTIESLRNIIDSERPAHTSYRLDIYMPTMELGNFSIVEENTILGE